MKRPSGRAIDALRSVSLEPSVSLHAEGSCFAKFGNTHVLCTASIDERVPAFLRNSGKGWVTAEYGMLPRSTHSRIDREAARGKQGGRTLEIQRLIGRSLRAVTNLSTLGERQIKIDCDVIQADGGTRTAAITGAWVALRLACEKFFWQARSMPIGTNSKCCNSASLLGDKTRLAQFDRPDRVLLVLSRSWLRLIPRAAHSLSIDWR